MTTQTWTETQKCMLCEGGTTATYHYDDNCGCFDDEESEVEEEPRRQPHWEFTCLTCEAVFSLAVYGTPADYEDEE